MSWLPTRSHKMWSLPATMGLPMAKVARPSEAHDISYTSGRPDSFFTRSPGRNQLRRPASISFRSAMKSATRALKRSACSSVSLSRSR